MNNKIQKYFFIVNIFLKIFFITPFKQELQPFKLKFSKCLALLNIIFTLFNGFSTCSSYYVLYWEKGCSVKKDLTTIIATVLKIFLVVVLQIVAIAQIIQFTPVFLALINRLQLLMHVLGDFHSFCESISKFYQLLIIYLTNLFIIIFIQHVEYFYCYHDPNNLYKIVLVTVVSYRGFFCLTITFMYHNIFLFICCLMDNLNKCLRGIADNFKNDKFRSMKIRKLAKMYLELCDIVKVLNNALALSFCILLIYIEFTQAIGFYMIYKRRKYSSNIKSLSQGIIALIFNFGWAFPQTVSCISFIMILNRLKKKVI